VLKTTKSLVQEVADIVVDRGVDEVVLGDSQDFKGKDNPIMKQAHIFRKDLEKSANIAIHLESETLSTKMAERIQGRTPSIDASAASIILQSFLDNKNNKNE